ncbi:hypothetical protein [Sphingomonas sanguinis]|uniref:Uncharacterized protein n=1 Tax=Sphingomonas sanguinis TaxID=33051 RepID=A0A147IRZ9_9SPHN|nr:hypothetical protein [Sphingomonas sanguinis]KTT98226.1 hypothetical protein SB4_11800 [Sphingomonas sanguinis]
MLNAKGSHADGGGYYEPAPFAVLDNHQRGDNIVNATSGMTVSVPGHIGASSVTLSNNANSAFARMNDASNTLSVDAVDLSGDVVLNSWQHSTGKVFANADSSMSVGNSDAYVQDARLDVLSNSAASEANGNRALNALSVSSVTGSGGRPLLDNRQSNTAVVDAVTNAAFIVNGSGAMQSAIGIEGNSASSIARGNAALNRAVVDGMSTALVSNAQVNRGPVSATVNGLFGVAMAGDVSGAMGSVSGNGLAATGTGNQAVNMLTATGSFGSGSSEAPR